MDPSVAVVWRRFLADRESKPLAGLESAERLRFLAGRESERSHAGESSWMKSWVCCIGEGWVKSGSVV
jgi:hypothetical protein